MTWVNYGYFALGAALTFGISLFIEWWERRYKRRH